MNLYGFLSNSVVDNIDPNGLYKSKKEALDAATTSVGEASRKSREAGVEQARRFVDMLIPAHNEQRIGTVKFNDAVLFFESPTLAKGIAGVEYSSVAYCMDGEYNYTSPLPGRLPNRGEYKSGLYGKVAMDSNPRNSTYVAHLHSHTFTHLMVSEEESLLDGRLTGYLTLNNGNFAPDNSDPSPDDLKMNGEHYIVHERLHYYYRIDASVK